MKQIRQHIRTFLVLLLLLVGANVVNAINVTYKVINRYGGVAVTSTVQSQTAGDALAFRKVLILFSMNIGRILTIHNRTVLGQISLLAGMNRYTIFPIRQHV